MEKAGKATLTREQIIDLLGSSRNLREAASKSGVCHRTFERIARDYGLYRSIGKSHTKLELSEIIEGKHPGYPTSHLAKRLVKEGLKDYKCEGCGIIEWNGKSISLELDHVDGCSTNHLLLNLKLLCPNCHSQTPTYRSKKRTFGGLAERPIATALKADEPKKVPGV